LEDDMDFTRDELLVIAAALTVVTSADVDYTDILRQRIFSALGIDSDDENHTRIFSRFADNVKKTLIFYGEVKEVA
jgi:hypothetical protein